MRYIVLVVLLVAGTHAEGAADDYSEQLRQYDQRMAEARQREADQAWKSWLPSIVIVILLFVYLTYSQAAARRRVDALVEHSRRDIERTISQNQEIIELLKSINDRLEKGT
jgi:hypothetical protein